MRLALSMKLNMSSFCYVFQSCVTSSNTMSDPAFNIQCVQTVEKYPILYNYTLSNYSNKLETEKAWKEVGTAFNMTDKQTSQYDYLLSLIEFIHTV